MGCSPRRSGNGQLSVPRFGGLSSHHPRRTNVKHNFATMSRNKCYYSNFYTNTSDRDIGHKGTVTPLGVRPTTSMVFAGGVSFAGIVIGGPARVIGAASRGIGGAAVGGVTKRGQARSARVRICAHRDRWSSSMTTKWGRPALSRPTVAPSDTNDVLSPRCQKSCNSICYESQSDGPARQAGLLTVGFRYTCC
jgi:hypothetical protein